VPTRLKRLLPRVFLDMGKVGTGLLLRNLLTGLFKAILAATLAPGTMGILRAVQAFFSLASSLAEFGLKYALLTSVPAAIRRKDFEERDRMLMTSFAMMGFFAIPMLVLGNLFAGPIGRWGLGDPTLTSYARATLFAAAGYLLWRYVESYLNAMQQFGRLALFHATGPFLMLVVGIVLAALDKLTLMWVVAIVLFNQAAAAAIWWFALDRSFLRRSACTWDTASRITRFSRWIYLTNLASKARSHLNPLLLKSPALSGSIAAGEYNTGIYSFGNDMANEMQLLSGAIVTVLIPKAARTGSVQELRHFAARCYRYLPLILVPLAAGMFLARPALLLLGRFFPNYLEYLPSLSVFYILYVGGLFSIVSIPMQTVLYALNLPGIEARIEAAMVPLLVIGGLVLIPPFGAAGAAVSILIQRVIFLVAITWIGHARLREGEGGVLLEPGGE